MLPPNLTTQFDAPNCLAMAQCADAAYARQGWSAVEAQARAAGYTRFQVIEDPETSTQLFVAGNDQVITISICGTRNLKGWIIDLECWMANPPGTGYEVHLGFWSGIDAVFSRLLDVLQRWTDNGQRLFVCGHSLGGGRALILAERLYRLGTLIDGVYTFGSPRPGNKQFADSYGAFLGSRTWNVQHNADIVPFVPPLHWGYRRPGTRVFFDALDKMHFARVPLWFQLVSEASAIWLVWKTQHGQAEINEHFMDGYIGLCTKLCPQVANAQALEVIEAWRASDPSSPSGRAQAPCVGCSAEALSECQDCPHHCPRL